MTALFGEHRYNPDTKTWEIDIVNTPDLASSTPGGAPEAGRPEDDRPADRARFNTSRPVSEDEFAEDNKIDAVIEADYHGEMRRQTALYQAVKATKSDCPNSANDVIAWAKKFEAYLKGDA